ncbi:putative EF-hand domain-containing protein [Helianthus annuus]|uniref:EF-hand domain pair, mitochondrial Rho GTPase n=1 Tax=Helianthus annuus TaxID=4232 RepID=A0A251T2U8_HELAN|nr:putative EF-hand domain pair, mitochondrial Rho GTPase [Helianthus annuus]KAF5777692.1 putative guanylate cyclase activating protein [Helianthus annuus]KAJ0489194.1 putative EF-hand domain-containing protein [Helianthus annuus]KAJ0489195.1 putative EF-hand domain-containing protein [Helianthus annuus]KAJ0492914.1 putative EF-hand domain-containing protein [Helianthus annuus]
MSVELLDGAIILGFIEDDEAFNGSVQDRFAYFDTNHDGQLSYSEMLKELQFLRMIETHFGIDVKPDPEELSHVYDSLFLQFDRDSNGAVDLEESIYKFLIIYRYFIFILLYINFLVYKFYSIYLFY